MATKLNETERKFILETKATLKSNDNKRILTKLRELKVSGNENILPFILDLLEISNSEDIIKEVLNFIRDLKDQKCVPVIIKYIDNRKVGDQLGEIISSCWQSRLDFHEYLNSFATCFLHGDYQTSLEAFTLIEEMLWKSTDKQIQSCRKVLLDNEREISEEKKPLYNELIKVLDEGRSANSELYPDIYE